MRSIREITIGCKSTNRTISVNLFCILLITFFPFSVRADENERKPEYKVDHCPPFELSREYRTPTKSTQVNPSNWIEAVENAVVGEEILLQDGIYSLDRYAVVFNAPVTFRSASGNRESVIIEGQGYSENAEALMIMSDDVIIADLTVRNVRDHAISLQEGSARPVIYNVNLVDVGTQHIKGNRMGPFGVIACSSMGYTEEISKGDYNSAIDLHAAVGWTIRDNYIYNIYGDGSGCAVDAECGIYYPGGEPAILLWRDSRDNEILRNTIVGSHRGISLGLDTTYTGGVVEDNYLCRSEVGKDGINGFIEGDTGISLIGASHVEVTGNKVLFPGDYPGPIEVWKGKGITVYNNFTSKPIWNRGEAEYNGCSKYPCDDMVAGGELDNKVSASVEVDAETTMENEGSTILANPGEQTSGESNTIESVLSRIKRKEELSQSIDAQIAAIDLKLQQKELALLIAEHQLITENHMRLLELQQRTTQLQLKAFNRRVESLIGGSTR